MGVKPRGAHMADGVDKASGLGAAKRSGMARIKGAARECVIPVPQSTHEEECVMSEVKQRSASLPSQQQGAASGEMMTLVGVFVFTLIALFNAYQGVYGGWSFKQMFTVMLVVFIALYVGGTIKLAKQR